MRNKTYIGIGILLLITAVTANDKALAIGSTAFLAIGGLSLGAVSSGVEYSESHYRVYKRIFFWKTGHWKSILGVRKIYIRHFCYQKKNSFLRNKAMHEESMELVVFQVYFVRKSGYYKIFESNSLEIARRKANELARKYNLTVKERGNEQQEESQHHEPLLAEG